MSNDTHYTALGVPETASQLQIRAAYRNLLKQIHPDTVSTLSPELKVMAESATREIVEAYAVLSDPDKRSRYDRQLVESQKQCPANSVEVAHSICSDVRQFSRPSARQRRRHRRISRSPSVGYWLRHPLVALIVVLLICFVLSALLLHYVADPS